MRTSHDGAAVQTNIGPGSWKLDIHSENAVGVGGWPNSYRIPVQTRSYSPEPDIIEIPETRTRKLQESQQMNVSIRVSKQASSGSATETIQLPPLFSPQGMDAGRLVTSDTEHVAGRTN